MCSSLFFDYKTSLKAKSPSCTRGRGCDDVVFDDGLFGCFW